MKIGFVLDDTLDSSDGVQQYILSLGDWLRSQGHEVHYLVGETKRTDIPHIHSLSRNVRVHFNGNRMTIPRPASKQRIKALLDQEQFDVLHIQMPYSPAMGGKVIKAASGATALVGTFHILPFGWLQRRGAQLLSWYSRSSLQRLHTVLSVSVPAQTFAKTLGIESSVLPNVITSRHFNGAKPFKQYSKDFTIVFLGRLVERKGCKELLHIVKELVERKTIPNLKVVICGAGPELEQLQNYIEAEKLTKYVEFRGFIDEADKPRYLASADIAIFPSLGGESFGIVLLEAMASGAGVVLGGDNPGYASVLHEVPQALFDPRNTSESADLITKLYEDKKMRKSLHATQQNMVKQYDVAVVGKKLLSYYKRGS